LLARLMCSISSSPCSVEATHAKGSARISAVVDCSAEPWVPAQL
jgi:hypothetical protein